MNSKGKKYENMTPLEALEWIDAYSEDDVYHNITNEVNIIKKALSRLEQIEKERQEVETRLSSKETNTFDEIATMIKKAYDYDVLVNKCKQLEKENQGVKDDNTRLWHGLEYANNENAKLKKALDILTNNKFYIYGIKTFSSVKQYNNIIIGTEFDKLTQEEFELLKEVLQDE